MDEAKRFDCQGIFVSVETMCWQCAMEIESF